MKKILIGVAISLSMTAAWAVTVNPSLAQTTSETPTLIFKPEIPIPGFGEQSVTPTTLYGYLRAVFILFMGVVGILAVVMIIYGGIKWVAAAGNPSRIGDARETINSAIIGLIIALTSVLLLNLINPRYTQFQGLTIQTVDPDIISLSNAILASSGDFTRCEKQNVGGEPSKVCSGRDPSNPSTNQSSNVDYDCLDLNPLINAAARRLAFKGVDPFAIKAIIQIESPKVGGQPYSGPEGLTGPNNTPGPGYGIGQFKVDTLLEVLPNVNPGGLPPGCKENEAKTSDGKVSQTCRDWLDKRDRGALGSGYSGLEAQVNMIGYYYGQQLQNEKCIKQQPVLAAAAYNQGLGGASQSFCGYGLSKASEETKARIRANALNYVAKFKTAYAAACAAGN